MQLLVLFDSEHAIANSLHILMPFNLYYCLRVLACHFQSYTPQQILFSLAVWIDCAGIWGSDSSIEVSEKKVDSILMISSAIIVRLKKQCTYEPNIKNDLLKYISCL